MRSILTAMITVAAFLVPLPVSAVSITGKYVGRGLDFMVGRNEEKVGPTGEKAGPQHLQATIKRIRLQKYQVELSSYRRDNWPAWSSCGGVFSGIGTRNKNRLLVTSQENGTPACTLDVQFRGRIMRVKEGAECLAYHGARCAFDGVLTRR